MTAPTPAPTPGGPGVESLSGPIRLDQLVHVLHVTLIPDGARSPASAPR